MSIRENSKSILLAVLIIAGAVVAWTVWKEFFSGRNKPAVQEVKRQNVTINNSGANELRAELFVPETSTNRTPERMPGVVLLSPFLESKNVYQELAIFLCSRKIVVLSVDMGQSGEPDSVTRFDPASIRRLPYDAAAALDFLAQQQVVDSTRLGILGTALTARSAVLSTEARTNVRAAVLVSALLDSIAIETIKSTPFRPILVIASTQDAAAAPLARSIFEASQHPKSHLESYFNAGEGSGLWQTGTKYAMIKFITDWITEQLVEEPS